MYLIADANVLLAALLGKSITLLEAVAGAGTVLLIPQPMMREVQLVAIDRIPTAASALPLSSVAAMVTVLEPAHYEHVEVRARQRLSAAGAKDWPLVAAALALEAPVWSNDKHLWGTGVAVWKTRNIPYWIAEAPG